MKNMQCMHAVGTEAALGSDQHDGLQGRAQAMHVCRAPSGFIWYYAWPHACRTWVPVLMQLSNLVEDSTSSSKSRLDASNASHNTC